MATKKITVSYKHKDGSESLYEVEKTTFTDEPDEPIIIIRDESGSIYLHLKTWEEIQEAVAKLFEEQAQGT